MFASEGGTPCALPALAPEPDTLCALGLQAAVDFELFARHIVALQKAKKVVKVHDFIGCNSYSNGKCDTNDGHALGLNPMGNETHHWALSSPAQRVALRLAFVKWTLGLFYFLGTDQRVPAHVRSEMRNYSLCAGPYSRRSTNQSIRACIGLG